MASRAERTLALAALASCALCATTAWAEAPPLRVDYASAPGCPGADVFLDEVRWRTALARMAAPGEDALAVRARIVRHGAVSRGHLVLVQGASRVVRDIDGDSCDEVVSALALVTALAVDPLASTSAKPPARAPSAAVPTPDPKPPALPAPPPPAPPTLLEPQIVPDPLPVIPDVPTKPSLAPRRWVVGARGVADFQAAPRPLVGAGLVVARAFDRWWRPSVRGSVAVGATGGFDVGQGGVWFLRAIGRVEGCAFEWRPASRLTLVPCVAVEAGALHAEGILQGSLTYVRQTTSFWAAGDVLPSMIVDLGRVKLDLQGGPAFPFVRTKFAFESPSYAIYSVPWVTWTAALGVGVPIS